MSALNILCCFKIVNDYDLVTKSDWEAAGESGPDLSYVKTLISCFDEAGLETALRLKDSAEKQGQNVRITALTLGGGNYDAFFKNLFALGVERIIQGKTAALLPFSPHSAACAIERLVSPERYDLVITGLRSADGENGLTPFYLAKRLGLPVLSNVTALSLENGALRFSCDTGRSVLSGQLCAPAVVAVGNSVNPYLRMATLRQKLAVSGKTAEIVELAQMPEEPANAPQLCALGYEKTQRSCTFITGESSAEKARALISACPEVKGK